MKYLEFHHYNQTQLQQLCFAVSIGALKSVAETLHERSRKHGLCQRIIDKVASNSHKLPPINEADVELLKKVISQSSEAINSLKHSDTDHLLLNLCSFCLEEIRHILTKNVFYNLQLLFDSFDGVDVYSEIRIGDRCFQRLLSELEIESVMLKSA